MIATFAIFFKKNSKVKSSLLQQKTAMLSGGNKMGDYIQDVCYLNLANF